MSCCQRCICQFRHFINSHFQQTLQPGTDHIKGKIKNKNHNSNKAGNCRIFSGKNPVYFLASNPLFTFLWFHNCLLTQSFNKVKPHICNGCTSIYLTLCLHLLHNMFQHFRLVCIKFQPFQNQRIPFDRLGCCKTCRNVRLGCMILDQMHDRMNTPVDRSFMIVFITKVLAQRALLIFRNM